MTMSISTAPILSLRRPPRLRSSLPLTNRTSSFYRLLSTAATTQSPPPSPHFVAVDYLIQSCGLPSDGALRASKVIQHLKSPDKPDAVLCFLRQIGISESDIRIAVSREPRILVSHVEKNWRPNVAKLQEIGLSIEDISGIISRSPGLFLYNILPKIDFWIQALGSLENMSVLLKRGPRLLGVNLDNVVIPNITFLQEQCGLSACQISQLVKSSPRRITSKPEVFKMYVKRAKELGISPPSNAFVYALIVVGGLNQSTVDTRLCHLKSLGLSHEEVTLLITKCPNVLQITEKFISRKMEFLLKQAGCGKIDVIKNPSLLTCSLEKRLIPRSLVQKLLKSRGIPAANNAFASFMIVNEKRFLEKYVLPYEENIPGLHQTYIDACAGKTAATE